MQSTQSQLKLKIWQGSKKNYDRLLTYKELEVGTIYFVGDDATFGTSKTGIIYIAVSKEKSVLFGAFDMAQLSQKVDEIERLLDEANGDIDKLIAEVARNTEKLATIEEGAEKNKINAIERNGQAITPTEDKVINILIPIKTSELTNDSGFQTSADVAEAIVGVNLNIESGIITLTRKNGTTFTIDLPTEKIIKSGYYDSETEEIVMVLADDSEIRFSASQLIDEYYADNVTLEQYTDTADANKKKFRLTTSYKNKVDGAEQTSNKTASVTSASTATQYPSALAVWNAIKNFATSVQTFTTASTRANIESGETISVAFGKIKKWFSDLKAVAFSGSYNDLSDKPSIGNGKVTIKQKGVEKGSFSLNQSGDATLELTDENTTYGIATSSTAGLVKSGGSITVASDGAVSVNSINVTTVGSYNWINTTNDNKPITSNTLAYWNGAYNIANSSNLSKLSFELFLNGTKALRNTSDGWLRINDEKTFANGIFFGTGLVRTDGNFRVGSYADTALDVTQSKFTWKGVNVATVNSTVAKADGLRGGQRSRNNNSRYVEIGRITVPTGAYTDKGFSIFIKGQHNTNIGDCYIFNVILTTGASASNVGAKIYCAMASRTNYSEVLAGELTSTHLILYLDCVLQQYTSWAWSVLNDADGDFVPSSGNTYVASIPSSGGTKVSQENNMLAVKDGEGNTITSTYATKTELTDGSVTQVGTATLGSTTNPIYLSSGVPTAGNTYAGGTRVTLNGTSRASSTATFYAPTTYGSNGHVLIAKGSGAAPVFNDSLQISTSGSSSSSYNKVHIYKPLSFRKIHQVQSSSVTEFDWSNSSACVYKGATIIFNKDSTYTTQLSVIPVWMHEGSKITLDECNDDSTSNDGSFSSVRRTYTAKTSGLVFVSAWPYVFHLSSHEIFDKTLVINSLSDSRLTLVQSTGLSYYMIDLSSDNILYDGIVFDIPDNSYPAVIIGGVKMNNIPNCHVVKLYAKNGTVTLSRSDTDYRFAVTPGGNSYYYVNRNCYTEVLWYGNRWLTKEY